MRLRLGRTSILRHFLSIVIIGVPLSIYNLLPWKSTFLLKKKNSVPVRNHFCGHETEQCWLAHIELKPRHTGTSQLNSESKEYFIAEINIETIKIRGSVIIRQRNTLRHKLTSTHSFYIWRNWGPKRFDVWERSKTRSQETRSRTQVSNVHIRCGFVISYSPF